MMILKALVFILLRKFTFLHFLFNFGLTRPLNGTAFRLNYD